MRQINISRDKQNNKDTTNHHEDYLKIFDQLPSMIWHAGLDTMCDYFNQSWLLFTGRTLEQELGEGWMEGVHPEDLQRVLATYIDGFAKREPFEMEYRIRHHSGEFHTILDCGRPFIDSDGNFGGYVGTCYDISERKQMEKALLETNQILESTNAALRQSETMFKGLFEHVPDAVVAADEHGKIMQLNAQTQVMFGYAREDILGQPIEMLMPSEYHHRHLNHVSEFMKNPRMRPMGLDLSLYGQRKDGTQFPVDINLGPLQTESGLIVLATIRDTTERKQNEEAIREREKLLTTAALASPIVFFKIDRNGILRYSMGQSLARRIYNDDPIGQSIYVLYQDFPQIIDGIERALAGETLTKVIEMGGYIYEATYAPLQNEKGEITDAVGVAFDVTRHRQVEEALRESEDHFRTIFNNTTLGLSLVDLPGPIVETNPAFQEMLGYTAEELREKNLVDLIHPLDASLFQRLHDDLVSGSREQFQIEQRFIHKDGQVLWGHLAMSLFRSQDDTPLYGIGMVENISAQKQAEAELAELRRGLIDSAEFERLQLAQELHDGPLQDLQAMSFEISALQAKLDDQDGIGEVEALRDEMSRVVQSIRAVCGELRPPSLAPFGLEKAIRSHAEHFQEQHPELHLTLDLTIDRQELSERVRLALFRIYQHSLANIVKHANAKNITIFFGFDSEQIELRIEDDGSGFKVPKRWIELVRGEHYGLVGSIERAGSVGGKLDIQSSPGAGTVIRVTVPRREEDQVTVQEKLTASYT